MTGNLTAMIDVVFQLIIFFVCTANLQDSAVNAEIKSAIKAYWAPGLFFEELDLAYMGVIDGHDVKALVSTLLQKENRGGQ